MAIWLVICDVYFNIIMYSVCYVFKHAYGIMSTC